MLLLAGWSQTDIAHRMSLSRPTISMIFRRMVKHGGLTKQIIDEMSDGEFVRMLYPTAGIVYKDGEAQLIIKRDRTAGLDYPDFTAMALRHLEERIEIADLFFDYYEDCLHRSTVPISRTEFYRGMKKTCDGLKRGDDATMIIPHKYGAEVQIDYSGPKAILTMSDGKPRCFEICVLVWPASYMTYGIFIPDQTTRSTCMAIGRAFEFFGCLPAVFVCDNAKSMVISHVKGREAVFQPSFAEFMHTLGVDVMPAPPRAPQLKSCVEDAVRRICTNVLPFMDFSQLRTLDEWNQNLMELINRNINQRQLRKTGKTREQLFNLYEKPAARPLVRSIPEFVEVIANQRIPRSYCVKVKGHGYSVPYNLIGQICDIKISPVTVCIYHQNKLVAEHPRSMKKAIHSSPNTARRTIMP